MKKVIWVNGCFDILHTGHIELLEYAKSLGTHLIVGLDSDHRVKFYKGKHRPILPLEERMKIISSLSCVDEVVSFNDDHELEFEIYRRNIDVMVVGEEYKSKGIIGHQFPKKIEYFKFIKGQSSTNIVNRILEEYCKERFHNN
jgi:rfaE bifunctional protein nucleotidyltransferase chain/domain